MYKYWHPAEASIPPRWVEWIRAYKAAQNETNKKGEPILGLGCSDFPRKPVSIEFVDGSKIDLEFAFYAENDKEYVIFTEHLGYHMFRCDEVSKIEGVKR